MSANDFFQRMMPHAQRVSERTGLDPRLVLAQAALETGYGKHAPDNNYFGIKSHGRKGGNSLQTKEFENGQMVTKAQSFRGYSDPGQSFDDYAAFLERNPRYKPVLAAGGLDEQIAAMGRSGYATDPNYASKLSKIAGMVDGDFTPSSQAIADGAMLALGKQPLSQPSQPSGGGGDKVLVGGLLGDTMGADMAEYEPEKAGGLLGKVFPNMTANRRDEIKMALAGMSLNPNQALVRGLEGRMEGRREDEREFKTQQKAQAQANKTQAFIEAQVRAGKLPPELLEMARVDPASAYNAAVGVLTQQPKDNRTALMQNVEYVMQQNPNMSFDEALQMARSGGTTVNVGGDSSPGLGKLSTDFGYVLDPETGKPRIDPQTGLPTAAPVPGSPAAREIVKAEDQADLAANSTGISSGIVLDEIALAKELVQNETPLNPTTGFTGKVASVLDSTKAGSLKNRLQTIKANIGFDKLQAMREASPTGGALGAVSEFENRLLQSVYGSLEQAQNAEDITYNLNRLEQIYNRIINQGIPDDEARQMYMDIARGVAPSAPDADGWVTIDGVRVREVK